VAAPKILLGIVVLLLRMTKSGPSKNSSFKINFTISRTHRKKKNSSVRTQLPQLPAQSALSSAFMVKNELRKTRIWRGSRNNDYRYFKHKYDVEDRP
jgi:hypothetical protein